MSDIPWSVAFCSEQKAFSVKDNWWVVSYLGLIFTH